MNAGAVLKAHGWRGHGHTLHATSDSTGLAKPLLLPRKDNKLGVGKMHATTDQWWLSAFDQQLQGLDTSKKGVVVQTVTHGRLNAVAAGGGGKYQGVSGLYATFVKGGMLEGTITPGESTDTNEEKQKHVPETKEERRARREAKRLRKADRAARRRAEALGSKIPPSETKEDRRLRREARRKRRKEEAGEKDSEG